jgi:uncharacterized membrane protein
VQNRTASKSLGWLLSVGGLFGWFSSFTLTIDKIKLLENPNYISSCNVNSVLACGNVVKTAQASVFGFPNSVIGVSSFPILVLIGVLILLDSHIPRWMLQIIALVSGLATVFVSWLAFQSIYVIEILCPYCIVVWGMTVPIFFLTTRDLLKNSRNSTLKLLVPFTGFLTLAWFLVVGAAIVLQFVI